MANTETIEKDPKKEILRVARERFDLADEAYHKIYDLALEDLKFRAGEQWPEEIKKMREDTYRPCLTINRIPQFERQVTNDQRQNNPSNKVHPVDDKADVETAEIIQGLYRHIENNSNADIARTTAFVGAVQKGFGFYRIITAYDDPMSFNQEIYIKRIRNHFTVKIDPNIQEIDGSDMNWAFIGEDIPKEEYKAQYPDSEMANMEAWKSTGDQPEGWVTESTVRVVEYFYKEFIPAKIYLLSDGTVLEEAEYKSFQQAQAQGLFKGITLKNERKTTKEVIKWCKINGVEILDETTWPGKWIPIIPVFGDELDVNGELIYEGIIRNAKDPQRMYNYFATTETEAIALAPKTPFIGYEGQFEGHESKWATANTDTHAYLEVKPLTIGGQAAPLPQRNAYEPPVQAITNARLQSSDDLKGTTGIYDSALGAQSREVSGVAIRGRQQQSQTSNYHFMDNMKHSMRHEGRIIVDLIPKVYDAEQAKRIIGEDGEQEIIWINKMFERNGKQVQYNLGIGQYDVVCEMGPSFATKRQEASETMLELSRNAPQIMGVAGDLVVKNFDVPGASEIAERLKKTLPPGIVDEKNKQPIPPEVQQQLIQYGELVDQLTAKVNEQNEQIKLKVNELESKERIEMKKLENALVLEQMKQQGAAANAVFMAELASIQQQLQALQFGQPIDSENFNDEGSDQAGFVNQPNPTGGQSPGLSME